MMNELKSCLFLYELHLHLLLTLNIFHAIVKFEHVISSSVVLLKIEAS